ncbi:hypothetical protein LSAT2_016229 [Lamellibrachia satsuma]|nr:hypothetical protein LSAT2_016229 [Lamellibrachia satsuma]
MRQDRKYTRSSLVSFSGTGRLYLLSEPAEEGLRPSPLPAGWLDRVQMTSNVPEGRDLICFRLDNCRIADLNVLYIYAALQTFSIMTPTICCLFSGELKIIGQIIETISEEKKAPENDVEAAITQLKQRKKLEDTILDMMKQLEGEIVDRAKLEDLFKQVLRNELVQLWRCGWVV